MGNETSKSGSSGGAAPSTSSASHPRSGAAAATKTPPSASVGTTRTQPVASAAAAASSTVNSPPSGPQPARPPTTADAASASPPRASAPVAVKNTSAAAAAAPTSAGTARLTIAPVSSLGRREQSKSTDVPLSGSVSTANVDAAGSSVPRYVDANSVVYTLPSFTSEVSLASAGGGPGGVASGGGGGGYGGSQTHHTVSAPVPLRSATSGSDFRLGQPSSPLSPMRRHVSVGSASSPIAIPTYNTVTTSAVEDLSCSSPVLRSYRQHSFSTSKRDMCLATSPTSPPITYFGSSSFNANAGDMPGLMLAGSITSTPSASVAAAAAASSGGGAGTSAGAAIHTKFLEITGHPLGLENYGNTCYCNSVIQLIYHCTPLRLRLLELYDVYQSKRGKPGFEEDTVLYQLCSLIALMHKSNNRSKEKHPREKIAPRELLQVVKKRNEIFNNDMQQDAHEFTMFLINDITETEQRIMADPGNATVFLQHEAAMKKKGSSFSFWKNSKDKTMSANSQKMGKHDKSTAGGSSGGGGSGNEATKGSRSKANAKAPFSSELTPLQVILQGQFGSMTACLECENITARDEVFIDLSLETAQGCSLLRCLDHFGDPEYFWGKNKLRCDECKMPVRAAKTIHVQQLPQYALLIHLKRFQYDVKKQTFTKKSDHVALPMQMDVEEYLTDPEVIERNLRNEQARNQKDNTSAAASSGHKKEDNTSSSGGAKKASPDTFKPASEEVRSKLRGVAKHKARFELTGFVAHIGEGPNSGHYFTCVRYGPQLWRRFDDDTVSTMAERDVQQCFGVPSDASGVVTTTAYILLYERVA